MRPSFATTTGRTLLWEYARGSWVTLVPARQASVREAVKVADTLRYRVAIRPSIWFPVQLTGMSPGWHVVSTFFRYDSGIRRASQYGLARGGGPAGTSISPESTSRRVSGSAGERVIVIVLAGMVMARSVRRVR
ncbi:MAG: hypothetical protein ACRDND_19140 [Streptosporangiaceae bacterium]